MLQTQEHITALHNVCQQLDSSATGKAAETRLHKAFDKLHKIQQATLSAAPGSTGQHAKSEQAINFVQHTAAGPQSAELLGCESRMRKSMVCTQPDSVSESAICHPSTDAVTEDAVALDDARPAADEQDAVLPVQGKADGASVQNEHAAAAAEKSKAATDKRAQKEEAKVGSSNAAQANCIKARMFSIAVEITNTWL